MDFPCHLRLIGLGALEAKRSRLTSQSRWTKTIWPPLPTVSSSTCALGDAPRFQDAVHHALECLPVAEGDISIEKDGNSDHSLETPNKA